MSAPTSRHTAFALLAGSMALVGTYVALSKPLTAVIPVFAMAFLRFAIAAVAMLPWTLPARGEPALSRTEHRLFSWQGSTTPAYENRRQNHEK